MKDRFGRPVKHIRISINDDCNLDCFYCHREGQIDSTKKMSPVEIEKILMVAKELGISRVKITGGEPLIRKDLPDIIRRASKYMSDVSLTTNGTLLGPLAEILHEAGLNRVNISLDTLDGNRYGKITGKDLHGKVLDGISAAVRAGLHPVKINIVALFDSSMDEKHISSLAISERERKVQGRKIYTMEDEDNNLKDVEVVRPMHNTRFCSKCSRIRVTCDGLLKPCLMHNEGLVDALTPIRRGNPWTN